MGAGALQRENSAWEFPVISRSICRARKSKPENLKTFEAAEKRILPFQRKADLPNSGFLLILIRMTWHFSTQPKDQRLSSALQFTDLAIRITALEKSVGYPAKRTPSRMARVGTAPPRLLSNWRPPSNVCKASRNDDVFPCLAHSTSRKLISL